MKFNNKVTCKTQNNGVACESAKTNGLFREGFYKYTKHNSHLDVPEEILTESAERSNRNEELRLKESDRRLFENLKPTRIHSVYLEGRDKLFTSLMTRVFTESLELPEDVKEAIQGNINTLCESYFADKYSILEKTHERNIILESMYGLCESCAKKAANESCNNCKSVEELNGVKFELDEKLAEEFNKEADKIDFKVVSDMVKDKVLAVVVDEQKRAKKRKEFEEELNSEVDKTTVEESVNPFSNIFRSNVYGYNEAKTVNKSLFESLFESATACLMESIVTSVNNKVEDDDDNDEVSHPVITGDVDVPSKQDTLHDLSDKIRQIDEFQGTDDDGDDVPNGVEVISEGKDNQCCEDCGNECEDTDCGNECDEDDHCEEALNAKQVIHKRAKMFKNKIFKKAVKESVEPEFDIEEAFMEAFMNYTMIELNHTIGLETMDYNSVKSMIRENAKKIKK